VGSFSARIGNKRAVLIGLLALAVACASGGASPNIGWLLLPRTVEGIGFVLIVGAAPSLIAEVTNPTDIKFALAGWSAYMSGGVALVSLLAPLLLKHHTWRSVWEANAILLVLLAVFIAAVAKRGVSATSRGSHGTLREMKEVFTSRGPLMLAIIFGTYTMQHLSVKGFMPTLMHERFNLSEGRIGVLIAIAMASNILGDLAAGFLLQHGVSRTRIISWAAAFMACMSIGIFLLPLPFAAVYACALGFSCIGGLIPSSVMGAAPFHTPSVALLGATNGLLVQGSNLDAGFQTRPQTRSSSVIDIGAGLHLVDA